jgi:hypothetical protein
MGGVRYRWGDIVAAHHRQYRLLLVPDIGPPPNDMMYDGCSFICPDSFGGISMLLPCGLHDWEYRVFGERQLCGTEPDREAADWRLYHNAIRAGLSARKARTILRAVRGGGFSAYRYAPGMAPGVAYRAVLALYWTLPFLWRLKL